MTLLRVQDLAVARGGLRVLEGVSFDLDKGQALILRGPNGLGKTTLLRCVAGLQAPVAGRIAMPEDAAAYAAHADGLKPALTATENLAFWARVFGGGDVARALAAMELTALAHRAAGSLSAGQKRRLGLARLLVTRRPLWVLDEPTVSLDADSVARFAAVVADHLGQGGAALIATHIDLGLPQARVLDLSPFRARPGAPATRPAGFNEAFA
ncbi:heme ABC exporter ATP-binding protein CcmA [Paracoccus sp. ME4]|uniref:heme ABC exporter ATP-binding protein CcmA n=1 Tax=Paracoccus sp. ME4 TaxID=3138066 RepID=UPI00398B6441